MIKSARIVLLGFGHMGQALAEGFLRNGLKPERIHAVDICPKARLAAEGMGLDACKSIKELTHPPSVFILAVKPQQIQEITHQLSTKTSETTFFLSIAAGVSIPQLQEALGAGARVVRAMPNTPASVGAGVTALCRSDNLAFQQIALAEALMSCVGPCLWLEDEGLMNAVTGISGSGPAYFYLMMEALEKAGVDAGLPLAVARTLAVQTCKGAALLAEAKGTETFAQLRQAVTSPGGTTQAALAVLEDQHFFTTVLAAVVAAKKQSEAMGKGV